MAKVPVVDFHIHPIHYDKYQPSALKWIKDSIEKTHQWEQFYETFCDPDNMVKLLKSAGIDYGIIMAELSPVTTGICTNEYVEEFCKGKPELIPFASVNPRLDNNAAKTLEELIAKGFKGLKIYPTYQHIYPNDPELYPVYAVAQEAGIPVMLHTGSSIFKGAKIKYGNPLYIDDVAVDFPDLNLLIVHGGRGFWYDAAYFLAKLHSNVYLEIAGLPPDNLLQYFPDMGRIAHKVIYGSDWPGMNDMKRNLQSIRDLPLSEEEKDLILGKNAMSLLGLSNPEK